MNRRSATEQNAPALVTPVPTMLGNNKIFSATILDFPANPLRQNFVFFTIASWRFARHIPITFLRSLRLNLLFPKFFISLCHIAQFDLPSRLGV
jgi:hypothetical protein